VGSASTSGNTPRPPDELDRKAMEREEAQALRERYLTMTPDGVGVRLSGRLTPEGAAVVRAAIDPLCSPTSLDGRSAEQRRADALVEVCGLALKTTKLPANGGDRPKVVVGVDLDTITRQLGAGTLDNGDRITPEAARRLVSGPLRRALVARDRGCSFPACDRVDPLQRPQRNRDNRRQ
jgi:hypothetical protein